MRSLTTAALVIALAATPATSLAAHPDAARAEGPRHCAHAARIDVPGAPMQKRACLDDLTTSSTVRSGPHRRQ